VGSVGDDLPARERYFPVADFVKWED
jgi:hypothetical protein